MATTAWYSSVPAVTVVEHSGADLVLADRVGSRLADGGRGPQNPRRMGRSPSTAAQGRAAVLLGSLSADPTRLLAVLVLLLAVIQGFAFGSRFAGIDFYQFWVVGQAVREPGVGDVYSNAEGQRLGQLFLERAAAEAGPPVTGQAPPRRLLAASARQVLEAYSTPWLYTLFGALSSGNFDRDQGRFQALSLAAQVAALLLIARLLGFSWTAAAMATVVFTAWFAPTTSEIRVGNVNRLQLGLLALVLLLRARDRRWCRLAAGVALGMAVAFKPNLGYAAVTLLGGTAVLGRWRTLIDLAAGTAAGMLVAFGLSSWLFGTPRAWLSWLEHVTLLLGAHDRTLAAGNFALSRVLDERFGVSVGGVLSVPLLALALAVAWRARAASGCESDSSHASRPLLDELCLDVLLVSLGAAASLLGSPLAWLHYFVLVTPLALWLLRPLPAATDAGRRAVAHAATHAGGVRGAAGGAGPGADPVRHHRSRAGGGAGGLRRRHLALRPGPGRWLWRGARQGRAAGRRGRTFLTNAAGQGGSRHRMSALP